MFKRVEKRLKRKQDEDELGLDGEMKDILGLNDTDSDESDSDDNSDNGSSEGDFPGNEDDENMELHGDHEDSNSDAGEDELEDDERALISVSEALNDTIFIISLDPDIKECIVCPGKLLKGIVMVEKHKSSNAHERRFKQFRRLAASAAPNAKAQDFVMKITEERGPQTSAPPSTSKRAEKKHTAQEKRRVKREKFKARQRAKKEVLTDNATTETRKKEPEQSMKAVRGAQGEKEVAEGKKKGKAVERLKKADISAPTESFTELIDAKKAPKRHNEDPAGPPKKKRKTFTSPIAPATKSNTSTILPLSTDKLRPTLPSTKPKSKPKPTSEPDDSPVVIQELQSQVKDIIKSASSLAKAARARAFNGDDDKKQSSLKKRKTAPTKMKVQKS